MSWIQKGKRIVQGFAGSLSGWETSYWGGYEKVLWDYPEIKMDFDLEFENPKHGMSWYTYRKLIKIFLLKVNQFKKVSYLTAGMETKEVKDTFGNKSVRHSTVQDSVLYTLGHVINEETELRNLFTHYREVIEETVFFYDEKPQNNQGSGNSGGGNGQGNSKSPSPRSKMQELLQSVKKQKQHTYSYGAGINEGSTRFYMMDKCGACDYTSEEIVQATHLSNMLDISFDPARDVVNSLRSGKLDPRKLCEIPSGNFNVYTKIEEDQITKPFAVCLLGDESGSMEGSRVRTQIKVFKVLYKAFGMVLPPDKMFIYGHCSLDNCACEVRVYNDKYNDTFEETIDNMGERDMGGTPCETAISMVYNKVREFTSDNIIFMYMTDGGTGSSVGKLRQTIEKCRRDGFVTIGVGIQSHVGLLYDYSTDIHKLEDMVRKISLIVNRVVKTEFQS